MKANELRIGNYIVGNVNSDTICKITSISHYEDSLVTIGASCDIDGYSGISGMESDFHPIPLTEDWLLKFGFEKISAKGFDSDYYHIKNGFGIYLHKSLSEDSFAYDDFGFRTPNGDRLWIDFVHQLQNLYFALTGEELHAGEQEL